jgi:hypothetical protein
VRTAASTRPFGGTEQESSGRTGPTLGQRKMRKPEDNESWIIHKGDAIIQKKASLGMEALTPWEHLVYCLWVADYGMRNAGDLETATDLYEPFKTEGQKLARQLQLKETEKAFSMPDGLLQLQYFDIFESICNEIKTNE